MQVDTVSGRIEGESRAGLEVFRGVPYAAPPVGSLRFCPPAPVAPWQGVRPAVAFSPSSIQPDGLMAAMTADGPQSEDCLYLNIYTPAADAGRRPVMVWIHGGIYISGSGSAALYDGGRLAERGDVVVVTINYRLGALGFLSLIDQGGAAFGATANAGQLDQIAALRWVRDNIAQFGGNPADVTIFGESAGSFACSLLMCMPAAQGLFHKVICQSGAAWQFADREQAKRRAATFMAHLGIPEGRADALRQLPPERILEAQGVVRKNHADTSLFPVVDGDTLPLQPADAYAAGAGADVPLLIGSNLDEWNLFSMATLRQRDMPMDDKELIGKLLRDFDSSLVPKYQGLVASYRSARTARDVSAGNRYVLDAVRGDRTFRMPGVRLAEAKAAHRRPAYMYMFTYGSPARRGLLGACHALELPFVFGTLDAPTQDRFAGIGAEVEALSRRMMDTWIAFARTGAPSGQGLPEWVSYDTQRRATMLFAPGGGLVDAPFDGERAAWDGVPLVAATR